MGCFVLLCSILVCNANAESGRRVNRKKTPIVKSTPTSVPASKVKLFSATFFEESCRYFEKDGWGEFILPVVAGAARGPLGANRSTGKCSPCRTLADRYGRGCKRAIGLIPKRQLKALEPATEFIRYLTEVIHNSDSTPPLPDEIKTFLAILALAYQKAPPEGREYFSILDSYISPPLLAMLSKGIEGTPAPKHK
jgi:hypothetical protein